MCMLMFIYEWVTEALRGKWGIFFSCDPLNCSLLTSWFEIIFQKQKNITLHTWRKQSLLKNVAPLSKIFFTFTNRKKISPFFFLLSFTRFSRILLFLSHSDSHMDKKKSWKNVVLMPKLFFITHTLEK